MALLTMFQKLLGFFRLGNHIQVIRPVLHHLRHIDVPHSRIVLIPFGDGQSRIIRTDQPLRHSDNCNHLVLDCVHFEQIAALQTVCGTGIDVDFRTGSRGLNRCNSCIDRKFFRNLFFKLASPPCVLCETFNLLWKMHCFRPICRPPLQRLATLRFSA